MSDVTKTQAYAYAELELRYARGHERPARIRWSPPDRLNRLEVGMPAEADPLAAMLAHLSDGETDVQLGEPTEVDLLNAVGARGWQLVSTRSQEAGSSERLTIWFVRPVVGP